MKPLFDPLLLAPWAGGHWLPAPPAQVQGVVHDSKKITPGCLFVAIRGGRFDGHDFVAAAGRAGASAALVARGQVASLATAGIPLLVVEDTVQALQRLAARYRQDLGLTVVGVTGSTGKTTVKEMIACLLQSSLPTAWTQGNWNNEIGLPLSILAIGKGTRVAVLELGISHPGEMAPLCAIARPDWGVITNVGPVHLEFFDSVQAIAREKGELFRSLSGSGAAVLSLDEDCHDILQAQVSGARSTTSLRTASAADYVLAGEDRAGGLCTVRERRTGAEHTFHLPVPGQHNRHDALLAVAVARGLGVEWSAIVESFARYRPPAMRWERVETAGVTFINDAYNANPVSMRAAIRTFTDLELAGRKWLVLGDMLELGAGEVDEHRAIGRALAPGAWAGVVTVGRLGREIISGAQAEGWPLSLSHPCDTVDEAVAVLRERVAEGDAVLVKASRGRQLEKVIAGFAASREKG